MTPKWTHVALFGQFFKEKIRKPKSVFGLRRRVRIAYEPIPWNAQCDPKLKEKTNILKNTYVSTESAKKTRKLLQKGVQMGDSILVVGALGRSWGTFGAPVRFLTQQV